MSRPVTCSSARVVRSRRQAPWLAAVLASAALLGGCVSEATYAQSAADTRAESARREAVLAELQAQSLAVNERLQAELTRQAEVQLRLLGELSRMHERSATHAEASAKPAPNAAEVTALTQRIRQLEQQQRQAVSRAEELQAELSRLQASRNQLARTRKPNPSVQLDVSDPWY